MRHFRTQASNSGSRLFTLARLAACVPIGSEQLSADAPLPTTNERQRGKHVAEAQPWQPASPRAEITPTFSFDPLGGPQHDGALIISADERQGLHGCWQRVFSVKGGEFYRFESLRKTTHLAH